MILEFNQIIFHQEVLTEVKEVIIKIVNNIMLSRQSQYLMKNYVFFSMRNI